MKRTKGELVFNAFNITALALTIPVTLYPFVQRFFVKGLTVGAVKG